MVVFSRSNLIQALSCACGDIHSLTEPRQYSAHPLSAIAQLNELVKIGHGGIEADDPTNVDRLLQTDLIAQMIAAAPAAQRELCQDLIAQAGGISAALSAAFGPNVSEFCGQARPSQFRRRDFLTQIAATAAIVTLASCAQNASQPTTQSTPTASATGGKLEKTDLTIGFLPIACSIPIVLAEAKEFYQKQGLNVTLKKMPNWVAVRESAIAGELDAYHMLAPMPIAMSLGVGSTAFPVKLASIENVNGQSIVLASKHKETVKSAVDFKGLTIAIPFPFSMHNLLLRYYLASGGLNPDQDLTIQIVPPPEAVAKLAAGQIDGFILPDNFGQRAVFEQIGFIHLLTKDLWPGHPCCSFAASQTWIDAHPNTFRAVNKAIIESAAYANTSANRAEVATVMAARKYLNQPEAVLKAVLTGKFENGLGQTLDVPDRIAYEPYPWQSFAKWIAAEMVRWKLMPEEKADYSAAAATFMTDLARDLAKELGQTSPTDATRIEKLKFGDFDPNKVAEYLKSQLKPQGN